MNRGKQYQYVIKILSTKERLKTTRAIFQSFMFKITHKIVGYSCTWPELRTHSNTINLFIEFVKQEKQFLGGYVN